MCSIMTVILPQLMSSYMMVGEMSANLIEYVVWGIVMFDCVLPTRNVRHGMLFTYEGIINIRNEQWKNDFSSIDPKSSAPTSRRHSKAYLRHLFLSKELLGAQIASLHNLSFYMDLVRIMQNEIRKGTFSSWKDKAIVQYSQRL